MKELQNRLLDLCLHEEIEDSKEFLDILYLELKFYKNKLDFLDREKPFWFQKKKIEIYNKERIDLEEKISICKKNILEELELMSKMVSS